MNYVLSQKWAKYYNCVQFKETAVEGTTLGAPVITMGYPATHMSVNLHKELPRHYYSLLLLLFSLMLLTWRMSGGFTASTSSKRSASTSEEAPQSRKEGGGHNDGEIWVERYLITHAPLKITFI